MATLHFKAVIKIIGINPYVLVSKTRAAMLKPGWRKPLPVLVQINGQPEMPWHINMMPVGNGSFYLYLHGDVRKASGTKVGDKVEVTCRFDADYKNGPLHPMPSWFSIPLYKNKKAKYNWEALTPSRQKEVLRYLSHLKSDEARLRNLKKVINALSGKQERFMGRSWN